jgi:hypothetical protein
MTDIKRLVSAVLLGLGVLLVFLGMSSALEFTPGGLVASVAAIAALLYAGASWFAPQPPPAALAATLPIVFDRNCLIVTGPAPGQPVAAQFGDDVRAELEQRCIAALNGVPGRLVAAHRGRTTTFEVVPVRSADSVVVYGMLVTAEAIPSALAASA